MRGGVHATRLYNRLVMPELDLPIRVEAICVSRSDRHVAKAPVPEGVVEQFGFAGDRHAGEMRLSRTGRYVKNTRPWSAVSTEEVNAICKDLGVTPFALGAMGENLRLSGIELANIPPGTVFEFPSGARLLVTEQNPPCQVAAGELAQINGGHLERDFVRAAFGRRGVVGIVQATGIIRTGDSVKVLVPALSEASA